MDRGYILQNENPKTRATSISKLFFGWMLAICYKTTKHDLQIEDLYKLPREHQSKHLTDKLECAWNTELKKSHPSLGGAIFKLVFQDLFIYSVPFVIEAFFIKPALPLILAYFLKEYQLEEAEVNYKIHVAASFLVFFTFLDAIFSQQLDAMAFDIGMNVRIAVTNLIYRKILNLRSSNETAVGQVANLISNDVMRFDLFFLALFYIVTIPIFPLFMCFLFWEQVGFIAFTGMLVPIIVAILQYFLCGFLRKIRARVAGFTGIRVKLVHEVAVAMKMIKMYAWEKPFQELITKARDKEIGVLRIAFYFRPIVTNCLHAVAGRLSMFITVASYVFLIGEINPYELFTIVALYDTFTGFMNAKLALANLCLEETLASVQRITEFLLLKEKPLEALQKYNFQNVIMNNVFARYPKSESDVLKNLDLNLPAGSLCVIIGSVGSGKSSFLQLLLGELDIKNGAITASKDISYASQNPWIFSSTVRNNIVFGQEFNESIYKRVIEVCALDNDLKEFSHGDLTIVGERGVVLSGGQRARINLARAVYKNSQIVLLDDPLSAVDAHVGKHIFDECIVKFLKNKTRILVTHQLQYIETADLIVVLDDGEVKAKGTFKEILAKNLDIVSFIREATESRQDTRSFINETTQKESTPQKLEQEEMYSSKASPFRDYIKASGSAWKIMLALLIYTVTQVFYSSTDYWVTLWSRRQEIIVEVIELNSNSSNTYQIFDFVSKNFDARDSWVLIYGILTFITVILLIVRQAYVAQMLLNASHVLHDRMLNGLLYTPLRFFDVNPSGRILNRFSKDLGAVDEQLPIWITSIFQLMSLLIGNIVMIIIANYFMTLPIVVLTLIYIKILKIFITVNVKVRHVESVVHSPVFSYVNWTLSGLPTIRSFKNEEILKSEFENNQDVHSSAWLLSVYTRNTFSLWLKIICVILTLILAFASIFLKSYGLFNASDVGLALSQCMILLNWVQNTIAYFALCSNNLTNLERIVQYSKLADERTDEELKEIDFLIKRGSIEFKNVTLQYNKEDPEVLKNINFVINPGDKIGIVGRTGAGKSSLISVLFRLTNFNGQILIDGKDTKSLKLEDLRRNISIIPQEPVLFSATLRYNLDPFDEYDDEQLWKALDEVKLKETIKKLDCLVSEDGSNFSLGQRQLLCLARAILRNNKIFVLDEATANIDLKTDSLIQRTIREKFQDCTVLTIAHRLDTVIDSDKILVMDFGKVVEFDTPETLLKNPEGSFSRLVETTGTSL